MAPPKSQLFWKFECSCGASFDVDPDEIIKKTVIQCPNCGEGNGFDPLKRAAKHWAEFKQNLAMVAKDWAINIPGLSIARESGIIEYYWRMPEKE